MSTPDTVRKLASSIAQAEAGGHTPAWTGNQIDASAERWEARLRSAFPSVASVPETDAVAWRYRVRKVGSEHWAPWTKPNYERPDPERMHGTGYEIEVQPLHATLPSISSLLGELSVLRGALETIQAGECRFAPQSTCLDLDAPPEARCPPCIAHSAMAPGSGRLAGEVLMAVGRTVEAFRRESSKEEHARLAREVTEKWDALLQAHPEIREGGE